MLKRLWEKINPTLALNGFYWASQQHAGLQHEVLQPQHEVTRPNVRFKPASPQKSGVDGGDSCLGVHEIKSRHWIIILKTIIYRIIVLWFERTKNVPKRGQEWGGNHFSVVSSAPSILRSKFQIPSTPSMLCSIYIVEIKTVFVLME